MKCEGCGLNSAAPRTLLKQSSGWLTNGADCSPFLSLLEPCLPVVQLNCSGAPGNCASAVGWHKPARLAVKCPGLQHFTARVAFPLSPEAAAWKGCLSVQNVRAKGHGELALAHHLLGVQTSLARAGCMLALLAS